MREILLNPGPVSLSDKVRKAATAKDLCHREPEYFQLQDRIREQLLAVYDLSPEDWSAVLLGGSGTAAMEAMVATLVPRDGRLLVLENGVYGERLSKIAAVHGIEYQALNWGWDEPVDSAAVDRALAAGQFSHLAMVHHETTTGRLNDIQEIIELCSKHKVQFLLDGVSSFGAEHIDFNHKHVSAVAATANKCLHGIPGLCFVLCRHSALHEAAVPARTLYLDLARWNDAQQRQGTPFTPATNSALALAQALEELHRQGGWEVRRSIYRQRQQRVREKLAELGVEPLLPPAESSAVLRSYYLPTGMDYDGLHDRMKLHGFVIYAGQGGLAQKMFRISTMGEISDYDMRRLDGALEAAIGGH